MYRKKVMTTGLAILAIVMAISLITASSGGSGLVSSAFAVKKGDSKTGTSSSSSSKSSSSTSTSGTSTGSKSKFIKCVTAISGSPSKADVDKCWDQVFGGGSGLTLGGNLGGGGSTLGSGSTSSNRASSGGSSGHGGTTGSGSST
jgi:hypothetical protein